MQIEQHIKVKEVSVPTFFYGTAWKEGATQQCVHDAIKAGFRGIDTANQRKHYYEEGVGAALVEAYEAGTIRREDVFLQTKFTHIDGQDERLPYNADADIYTQVMQSFASSLKHLRTDYLDSLVLHGPSLRHGLANQDWEVWRAMEELHKGGKVKLLGVSNVMLDQVQLLSQKSSVKPSFVQNRCYAKTGWDRGVREFCKEHDIHYQGFSLLNANSGIVEFPEFRKLLSRYGCSPAQLIFCFALQVQMIPLTGTTDPEHMREDLAAYGITLDMNDVQVIESIIEK